MFYYLNNYETIFMPNKFFQMKIANKNPYKNKLYDIMEIFHVKIFFISCLK